MGIAAFFEDGDLVGVGLKTGSRDAGRIQDDEVGLLAFQFGLGTGGSFVRF